MGKMDIAITGNINVNTIKAIKDKNAKIHKVLRPGYKLHVGSVCNDGRPITESWRYKQAVKMGVPIVRRAPTVAPGAFKGGEGVKEMFVEKYAPKTVADIIGHKESISQIREWLDGWRNDHERVSDRQGVSDRDGRTVHSLPEKRGVLVTGPPGIGKTTAIHLIAAECGYKVSEYNASDTRSVAVLRGLIALGIKRLVNEVIVMDEIDGLSERGGVGELADIIRKTQTPIICIANEKPPKLRPIINACIDIKFCRPNKSTIAGAMLRVAKAEGICITKAGLEELCENSGNDIRAILNSLEFYGNTGQAKQGVGQEKQGEQGEQGEQEMVVAGLKDANLRMDIFSATQKLFSNKRARIDEAANYVFVDYSIVPLMTQEAYLSASKSLDEAVRASEFISVGDIIDRRIHRTHDWNLLPHYVNTTVAVAKSVSGYAPFQIFPQWLGKNSKRMKHARYMTGLAGKMACRSKEMRLDYAEPLNTVLMSGLVAGDIKGTIRQLDELRLTRDDVMDELQEVLFDCVEIPSKVKTAFTREYNKTHSRVAAAGSSSVKKRGVVEDDGEDGVDEDGVEEQDEVDNLQKDIEMMEI